MRKFLLVFLIFSLLLTSGCGGAKNNSSEVKKNNATTLTEDQKALLKINNYATTPPKHINVEYKIIQPYDDYWDYNHQTCITKFKDKLFVAYSTSHDGEGQPGTHIMVTSTDNYENWETPYAVVPLAHGYYSDVLSVPVGFYATNEQMNLYYFVGEYEPSSLSAPNKRPSTDGHNLWRKWYYKTTKDGVNWSEPVEMGLTGTAIAGVKKTSSGRLFMTSANGYYYTDDPTGLTGWKLDNFENDLTIWEQRGLEEKGRYQESNLYEFGGYIYLLCRSGTEYMVGARTKDFGDTWSKPSVTSFSENATKFGFFNMPDGRIAYVGSPGLEDNRLPLMLCLSENGFDFDKQYVLADEPYTVKKPGFAKSGHYGYPAVYADDEYIYAAYSKGKEIIEVARVKLSDLN